MHHTFENLKPPQSSFYATTGNPRLSKASRKGQNSRNESRSNLSVSQRSSKSPTKSIRELQVLEIPPEYDTDSDQVVEYMLGDKAVEIEAPLYQVNIANKLVY